MLRLGLDTALVTNDFRSVACDVNFQGIVSYSGEHGQEYQAIYSMGLPASGMYRIQNLFDLPSSALRLQMHQLKSHTHVSSQWLTREGRSGDHGAT